MCGVGTGAWLDIFLVCGSESGAGLGLLLVFGLFLCTCEGDKGIVVPFPCVWE